MDENKSENEILIFYNKNKNLYLFLLCLVFIIFPFILTFIGEKQIMYVLLTLTFLYFGPFAIWYFSRIFINKPAIIINNVGINDNSGFLSVGLIEWKNIKKVKTSNIFGKTYIVVDVNNKKEILSRQNLLKKFFINMNARLILIQANNLESNLEELYKTLSESFQENKNITEVEKEEVSTDNKNKEEFKIYTKNSINIGSFLGGPMAGLYMVSKNFSNFGKIELAKKIFWIGVLSTMVLLGFFIFIPENIVNKIPMYIIPAMYTLIIYQYASSSQGEEIDKHIQNKGERHSGWKVTGIIILSLFFSLLYFFLLVFIQGLFQ